MGRYPQYDAYKFRSDLSVRKLRMIPAGNNTSSVKEVRFRDVTVNPNNP
jgi:hypothetical protein